MHCRVFELLRHPYSDAPLEQLLSAAAAAASEAAPATPATTAPGNVAAPTGVACSIAAAGAGQGKAGAGAGYYDAKPPAWAEKLCVT